MRTLNRSKVNKRSSARRFRHNTRRAKALNTRSAPNRGGWRL